eukprot:scaffold113501_cov21-Phaeocystis_antarctica.AAC.1
MGSTVLSEPSAKWPHLVRVRVRVRVRPSAKWPHMDTQGSQPGYTGRPPLQGVCSDLSVCLSVCLCRHRVAVRVRVRVRVR